MGPRSDRHAESHLIYGGGVPHLADSGFTPTGDLIYFGVADEEAGGTWGAEWMFEHHADVIDADYVLTELGGWSSS